MNSVDMIRSIRPDVTAADMVRRGYEDARAPSPISGRWVLFDPPNQGSQSSPDGPPIWIEDSPGSIEPWPESDTVTYRIRHIWGGPIEYSPFVEGWRS